jgi:hypothetical protein
MSFPLVGNPSDSCPRFVGDQFGIVKKDAGQASMTEYLYACDFTYGLINMSILSDFDRPF